MVEMVSSFFLEEVASCNGCMTKQPGYLQLPVGEVSTKVADQKGAFGFPAFCSYDLFWIVSLCLLALMILNFVVQECYFKWSVIAKESMFNLVMYFVC